MNDQKLTIIAHLMNKAVELGLFPEFVGSTEEYLKNWNIMAELVKEYETVAQYVAGVVEKPENFNTEQTAFVSPLDCNHFGSHLLHAHRMVSTDGHEQNRVVLCRKCGQFSVFGDVNGQHFSVTFELVRDEHLDAAGQYMRYLDYCEKKREEQRKNER